jgi:hypothetical protein
MSTQQRLRAAMTSYAVLALLSALTLDGKLRIFLLILLAALAAKTWIASKKEQGE